MMPEMTYSEVQSKYSECIRETLRLKSCFSVCSATLEGVATCQSLEMNVASLLDVFVERSEALCVLIDEVDHGYRAIIEGLEKQLAESREVQS